MKRFLFALPLLTAHLFAQQTPNLKLNTPAQATQAWGPTINYNFNQIDAAVGALQNAFQGAWSKTQPYSRGQIVSYSGSSYMNLLGGNVNHQPDTSPAFWSLLAASSSDGGGLSGRTPNCPKADTFTTSNATSQLCETGSGTAAVGIYGGASLGVHALNADVGLNVSTTNPSVNLSGGNQMFMGSSHICNTYNLPQDNGGIYTGSVCAAWPLTDNMFMPGHYYGYSGYGSNVGGFGHSSISTSALGTRDYSQSFSHYMSAVNRYFHVGDISVLDFQTQVKEACKAGADECYQFLRVEQHEAGELYGQLTSLAADKFHYNAFVNGDTLAIGHPLINLHTTNPFNVVSCASNSLGVNVACTISGATLPVSSTGTLGASVDVGWDSVHYSPKVYAPPVNLLLNTTCDLATLACNSSGVIVIADNSMEQVVPTAYQTWDAVHNTQVVTVPLQYSHNSGATYCAGGMAGDAIEDAGTTFGAAWKGNWAGGATYAVGDLTVRGGYVWRSLVSSNTGNDPSTSPSQWTFADVPNRYVETIVCSPTRSTVWLAARNRGALVNMIGGTFAANSFHAAFITGVLDDSVPAKPSNGVGYLGGFYGQGTPWSSTQSYTKGQIVTFGASSYINLVGGVNHQPDTSPTFWTAMATGFVANDLIQNPNYIASGFDNRILTYANNPYGSYEGLWLYKNGIQGNYLQNDANAFLHLQNGTGASKYAGTGGAGIAPIAIPIDGPMSSILNTTAPMADGTSAYGGSVVYVKSHYATTLPSYCLWVDISGDNLCLNYSTHIFSMGNAAYTAQLVLNGGIYAHTTPAPFAVGSGSIAAEVGIRTGSGGGSGDGGGFISPYKNAALSPAILAPVDLGAFASDVAFGIGYGLRNTSNRFLHFRPLQIADVRMGRDGTNAPDVFLSRCGAGCNSIGTTSGGVDGTLHIAHAIIDVDCTGAGCGTGAGPVTEIRTNNAALCNVGAGIPSGLVLPAVDAPVAGCANASPTAFNPVGYLAYDPAPTAEEKAFGVIDTLPTNFTGADLAMDFYADATTGTAGWTVSVACIASGAAVNGTPTFTSTNGTAAVSSTTNATVTVTFSSLLASGTGGCAAGAKVIYSINRSTTDGVTGQLYLLGTTWSIRRSS